MKICWKHYFPLLFVLCNQRLLNTLEHGKFTELSYWQSLFILRLHAECGRTFSFFNICLKPASWSIIQNSTGSLLPQSPLSVDRAAAERSQPGWKCVKKGVEGVRSALFWSGSGWLLAEWCWGARGVLIGGNRHDAQSQRWIIYLTHLWKLLKGLAHQAIWKSRESQSPEAKLSHLVVLFSPHCEHYVQYNHLGRRLEECHWRVHLKSCFWNSVSQFKSCILSYWTKGAVSVWWKIWSCKTQNFLNTVSKRKTKKSQVPVLERRSGKSWTCQAKKTPQEHNKKCRYGFEVLVYEYVTSAVRCK